MYNRYGFTPVALAVESPVLHLILNALLADTLFREESEHFFYGILLVGRAVKEAGIHHFAVAGIRFFLNIAAFYNLNYVNSELLRELPVALVMRRNSHNGARAVAHHYIV